MPDRLLDKLASLTHEIQDETLDSELLALVLEGAEPEIREAIQFCAFPHSFDASILAVMRGDKDKKTASSLLVRIAKYSFVFPSIQHSYVFHEAVRRRLWQEWLKPHKVNERKKLITRLGHYFSSKVKEEEGSNFQTVMESLYFQLQIDFKIGFNAWEDGLTSFIHSGKLAEAHQLLQYAAELQSFSLVNITQWIIHYDKILTRSLGERERPQEEFMRDIENMALFLHNKDLLQIGLSPIIKTLRPLIQRNLPRPIEEYSPVLIGDTFLRLVVQAIESLKLSETEKDTPIHRAYIYLAEFIVNRRDARNISNLLHVSQSTFYEIQRFAYESLSALLRKLNEKAEMTRGVIHSLGRPPYSHYIERYDDKGMNIIDDVIIPELRESRAWILAITGEPGVGKSSTAYATAEKVATNRGRFSLNFEAVIWMSFRQDQFQPGKGDTRLISNIASMSKVFDEIAATLNNREVFQSSLEDKQLIVERLMREHICLLVLDNLDSEWVSEKFKEEIENFVQKMPPPHKALVTMRTGQSWQGQSTIPIRNMGIQEAEAFMSEEARTHGLIPFTPLEVEQVYAKTKGIPLAMKQVLGLTRIHGYSLAEALDFGVYSPDMLKFMYQKAYGRLPISARKILLTLPLFSDAAEPEALEYVSGVSDVEKMEAVGRLYRSHMIEKTIISEEPGGEYGYTLLPFMREYLRGIRNEPDTLIDNISIQEFIKQASFRMVDYYIKVLDVRKDTVESTLLILKTQKRNLLNTMEWCWEEDDPRFIELLDFIGPQLGTLRYLMDREMWGRRAVEYLNRIGKLEDANWHQLWDVAWSLRAKGTPESRKEAELVLGQAYNDANENNWLTNKALALTNLGRIAMDNGDTEKAQNLLEESLNIIDDVDHSLLRTIALRAMADLMQVQGRLDEAVKIYLHLEDEYARVGNINGLSQVKSALALTKTLMGDYEAGEQLVEISMLYAKSMNPPAFSLAYALQCSSEIRVFNKDIEGAIEDAKQAKEIYKALGMKYHIEKVDTWLEEITQAKKKKKK
ncbi:MAG: ATP-binding protein [Chloroflexi bacterium]|nr:ATP-binding protein [Chloroflexota bacterium]